MKLCMDYINEIIDDDEFLCRRIMESQYKGKILSYEAFVDRHNELSVDRSYFRNDDDIIKHEIFLFNNSMKKSSKKLKMCGLAKIKVSDLKKLDVNIIYNPTSNNLYHSLIKSSMDDDLTKYINAKEMVKISKLIEINY